MCGCSSTGGATLSLTTVTAKSPSRLWVMPLTYTVSWNRFRWVRQAVVHGSEHALTEPAMSWSSLTRVIEIMFRRMRFK